MRRSLATLAAAAALAAAAPAEATFPGELSGLWVGGSCEAPTALLFVTRTRWARLDPEGRHVLRQAERFDRAGDFGLAVADDPEATRLLWRLSAEGLVLREASPKLPDSDLPGDGPDLALRRCPSIPFALAALHGEGLSLLAALDEIEPACAGDDGRACVDRVWAWADVSGDGGLSVAELARLVRGLTWFGAIAEGASAEEVVQSVAALGVGAIAAAWALLASVDYDGSGTVSREELARDRVPPPGLAGLPAVSAAAAPQRPASPGAIATALGAFGALVKDLAPLLERRQR